MVNCMHSNIFDTKHIPLTVAEKFEKTVIDIHRQEG